MRPGQFMIGTSINYALIGSPVVPVMTCLALTVFDLNMRDSWAVFAVLISAALIMMIGFG